MRSRWEEREFKDEVDERVYASRLLGSEPDLVLHGGGNTSVKVTETDHTGKRVEVLRVKGSGSDLSTIERSGFTGLRLLDLKAAQSVEAMSDFEMMDYLRKSMVDPAEPAPSVETFMHAFLPFRFVDHSHSDSILSLTNASIGAKEIRKILGNVLFVPYFPPGFTLAKKILEVAGSIDNNTEGIVLSRHGLFTFGNSAKESYEKHVSLVTRAEEYISKTVGDRKPTRSFEHAKIDTDKISELRGAVSARRKKVLHISTNPVDIEISSSEEAVRFQKAGPATPDMLIRTKYDYLFLRKEDSLKDSVLRFAEEYEKEFKENVRGFPMHDPYPSIIVLEGSGIITQAPSYREAKIIYDQFIHSFRVNFNASIIGKQQFISRKEAFDMEYWPLEEAKLKKTSPRMLQGSVSLVTGSGGGIGLVAAEKLAVNGSCVVLCDVSPEVVQVAGELSSRIRGDVIGIRCDISREDEVLAMFNEVLMKFGGVDILFNNAGILKSSPIDELSTEEMDRHYRVNSMGTFIVTREAFKTMKAQGIGGNIVFNITKNLTHPGSGMAAYGSTKAFAAQLCHYVSKEGGKFGIRSNIINPDKIFRGSAIWANGVLESRARAKNQTVEEYMTSNLLRREVLPEHVANVLLALVDENTFGATTDTMIPVDGGIL